MTPPLKIRIRRAYSALKGRSVITAEQDAAELRERLGQALSDVRSASGELKSAANQLLEHQQFIRLNAEMNDLTIFLRDAKLLTGQSPVKTAIQLITRYHARTEARDRS